MRLSQDWHDGMRGSVLQAAYIIDDFGEVMIGACGLKHAAHAFDAARSLVNNLGYIAYLVADRYIHIKLRPSLTSLMSYSRLMRWLDCGHPQRILVSYLSADEWHHEFTGSAQSAARCIDRIMERFGGGPLGNIGREIVPLHANAIPAAFVGVVDYWQAHRSDFKPFAATPDLRELLDDRFVLSTETGSGSFAIVVSGGGDREENCRRWLTNAAGASVRSAPDSAYGASCADAYSDTMRRGEPVMDNIDALVSWSGGSRVRYRYTRLMLPFSSSAGRWLLSCHVQAPRLRLLA
jgi:hypothetical protein